MTQWQSLLHFNLLLNGDKRGQLTSLPEFGRKEGASGCFRKQILCSEPLSFDLCFPRESHLAESSLLLCFDLFCTGMRLWDCQLPAFCPRFPHNDDAIQSTDWRKSTASISKYQNVVLDAKKKIHYAFLFCPHFRLFWRSEFLALFRHIDFSVPFHFFPFWPF